MYSLRLALLQFRESFGRFSTPIMDGKKGSFAVVSDNYSLVQVELSLDVLPVTEIATTEIYERRSRFSITQCLPVPSPICLWHRKSLPEQLLAIPR